MQVARKWGQDDGEGAVLDYSQKVDSEGSPESGLDISTPMADLSLKSRVDEYEDEDDGESKVLP